MMVIIIVKDCDGAIEASPPLIISIRFLCLDSSFSDSCDTNERDNSCGESQQSFLAKCDAHFDEIEGISEKLVSFSENKNILSSTVFLNCLGFLSILEFCLSERS